MDQRLSNSKHSSKDASSQLSKEVPSVGSHCHHADAADVADVATVTVVVENPISGDVIVTLPGVPKNERLDVLQKQLPCRDLHSMYKFMCEAVSLCDLLDSEAPKSELRLQACCVERRLQFDCATPSVTLMADIDGSAIASRHGSAAGGMAVTEMLPCKDGVASFEVVILEMEDVGSEGLEIGITGCGLADGFSIHQTYAVLSRPSWVSSDAGCLWINGGKRYGPDFQPWKDLVPKRLRPKDLVRLAFYVDSGDLEISVNGASQARWLGEKMSPKLVVSEGQQLFGLVGLRRPLKVASVRLPKDT